MVGANKKIYIYARVNIYSDARRITILVLVYFVFLTSVMSSSWSSFAAA
jgi:hypothetical protein